MRRSAADGRESVSIRSGQRFASDLRRATALDEQDRVQRALQPHIVKEGESHRYFGQKFGEWGPVFGLGDDATAEGDAAAGAPPPPVGDASAAPTESLAGGTQLTQGSSMVWSYGPGLSRTKATGMLSKKQVCL